MTTDEIIAMSKQFWLTEVGAETLSMGWDVEITLEDLEKIIHLVEQQEREKCAKMCEDNWHECGGQCAHVIRYGDSKETQ